MRLLTLLTVAGVALSACTSPYTYAGAGADPVAAGLAEREAEARGVTPPPVVTGPVVTGPTAPGVSVPTGISDENSFDAVTARETIQSDAERIERAAENYTQYQPEPLPARPAEVSGPNVIDYALSTQNAVGQQLYRRWTWRLDGGVARMQRACAGFTSAEAAQRAFLSQGGPQADPMGLDPDGDGFACGWDPTPFRAARG